MSFQSPARELLCSAQLVETQHGGHRPRPQAVRAGWGSCQDTRSGGHSADFCCQVEFHKGEVVMAGGRWSCVLTFFCAPGKACSNVHKGAGWWCFLWLLS